MSGTKDLDPALAAVLDAAAEDARISEDFDYWATQTAILAATFRVGEKPADVAELLFRTEKDLANNFTDREAVQWAARMVTKKLRYATQAAVAVLHALSDRWRIHTRVPARAAAKIERTRRLAIAMRMLADELDLSPHVEWVLLERPVRTLTEYFPHLQAMNADIDYDKTMCDIINDLRRLAEVLNARRVEMYGPPKRQRAGRRNAK